MNHDFFEPFLALTSHGFRLEILLFILRIFQKKKLRFEVMSQNRLTPWTFWVGVKY
jgi:hypothetical protein